jgi:hypothetical protein
MAQREPAAAARPPGCRATHRHEIAALRVNVVPASPLLPLTHLRQESQSQSESAATSEKC